MDMHFDKSLPTFATILIDKIGIDATSAGVFLRDISGRITFFSQKEIPPDLLQTTTEHLSKKLGPYTRPDRIIVLPSDFGSDAILSSKSILRVKFEHSFIHLIDRRLVGADWLRSPKPRSKPPVRFVFASLKGGVGRSTALSITASYLASRGKRVLAIDLDLEAPGIGSILLNEGTLPQFGLIDALVENNLSPLDKSFLADLVGPSDLSHRNGKIDVIPAFGKKSLENPGDILAKLSRAYAEDIRADGSIASIMDQVASLVDQFSDPLRYDAILIDARAGLHETTATAILGLGAEVFLFGLDEPQTFQGYAALLSHLTKYSRITDAKSSNFFESISFVQGKSTGDADSVKFFSEKCKQLYIQCGIESDQSSQKTDPLPPAEPFRDVPWDDDQSDDVVLPKENSVFREPATILNHELFRNFDPRAQKKLFNEAVYLDFFGSFIDRILESFPELKRAKNA